MSSHNNNVVVGTPSYYHSLEEDDASSDHTSSTNDHHQQTRPTPVKAPSSSSSYQNNNETDSLLNNNVGNNGNNGASNNNNNNRRNGGNTPARLSGTGAVNRNSMSEDDENILGDYYGHGNGGNGDNGGEQKSTLMKVLSWHMVFIGVVAALIVIAALTSSLVLSKGRLSRMSSLFVYFCVFCSFCFLLKKLLVVVNLVMFLAPKTFTTMTANEKQSRLKKQKANQSFV